MVVAAPQGGSNGPPLGARPTSAVRGRFGAAAMVTTAVAAAALSFYLAKLKFPAWSFGTAIGYHQWTIPTTLVVATLTATYLSWISARLASSAQPSLVSSAHRRDAWQTTFVARSRVDRRARLLLDAGGIGIRLWDWQNGRALGEPLTGHEYPIHKGMFRRRASPDFPQP